MTHTSPGTEVERAANKHAARYDAGSLRAQVRCAFLAGAQWMNERAQQAIAHETTAMPHDQYRMGYATGRTDAIQEIAAILPDKEQTR